MRGCVVQCRLCQKREVVKKKTKKKRKNETMMIVHRVASRVVVGVHIFVQRRHFGRIRFARILNIGQLVALARLHHYCKQATE